MPVETVTEILKDLQRFYGKSMNAAQLEFYRSQLLVFDEDDLCPAIVAMKGRESRFDIPSIATIRKYYLEVREARLRHEKQTAPTVESLRYASRTERGRESAREATEIIMALFHRQITREQYLARMYELEKKYPGLGWKNSADDLKACWATEKGGGIASGETHEHIEKS